MREAIMRFNFSKKAGLTLLALLPAASLYAASGAGVTGADFLQVGVGAAQLGMGGAAAASVDDANSLYWNPAGLASVKQNDVTASFNTLFQDESQGFLGYAGPVAKTGGGWGLAVDYLTVGSIQARTGDTETADSTFATDNYSVALGYGQKNVLLQGLSLGASAKYIAEDLPNFHASAFAVDLGSQYQTPVKGLSAGFALLNLGTDIGPDPLPLTGDLGGAYRLCGDKLLLAVDVDGAFQDKTYYETLGVDYNVLPEMSLRLGYQFGHAQSNLGSESVGLSAGVGFNFHGVSADYAIVPYGDLGLTNRITDRL